MRRSLIAFALAAVAGACARAPRPDFRVLGAAELFLPGLVSTAQSEVRLAVSPDGNCLLWGAIGWSGGPGGWDVFACTRTAAGWGKPVAAEFDSEANDFDPSFAPDGSGVYFFSNRPGGWGGDDIYFASWDRGSGRFGPAVNLGGGVNSPGDEWAPALSPDGSRLLFSSDGRGGRGKHDLFVSRRRGDLWDQAENLTPLNTEDEDFDATFLADGRSVVLSSGRLDGAVCLFRVRFRKGRYGPRQKLGPEINSNLDGAWTFGPSVTPAEPGVLYFTSRRLPGAGRADIYRIRYRD